MTYRLDEAKHFWNSYFCRNVVGQDSLAGRAMVSSYLHTEKSRGSSGVEQLIRNQQVVSSNLIPGSSGGRQTIGVGSNPIRGLVLPFFQ